MTIIVQIHDPPQSPFPDHENMMRPISPRMRSGSMATGLPQHHPNRPPMNYPYPNFNQSNMSMQSNSSSSSFRRVPDPPMRNMSASAFNLNQMGVQQQQQQPMNGGGWNGLQQPMQTMQSQMSQVCAVYSKSSLKSQQLCNVFPGTVHGPAEPDAVEPTMDAAERQQLQWIQYELEPTTVWLLSPAADGTATGLDEPMGGTFVSLPLPSWGGSGHAK
jgi:hypothetical protein